MTVPAIQATTKLEEAASAAWDVAVVGAGPAGTIAARELAGRGQRVLLIDKQSFPRAKVCGACLSRHALNVLDCVELGHLPSALGGQTFDAFRLWSGGSAATIKLPEGIAVTRTVLDDALVKEAIDRGVDFLPETRATLAASNHETEQSVIDSSFRKLRLQCREQETTIDARVVIAADGISGGLLAEAPTMVYRTWKRSRIGAGAVVDRFPSFYEPGAIFMAVGRFGYVGLVRAEKKQLNIGAALDASFVRRSGSVAAACAKLLDASGVPPIPAIDEAAWRGTTRLTRRPSAVAAERLFVIGDAAGYAEPFTGEGMAWAMTSAVMVAPFAVNAAQNWRPELGEAWTVAYRRALRSRQNSCFRLATLLRHPHLVRGAVATLSRFPVLAGPLVRRLNTTPQEILA